MFSQLILLFVRYANYYNTTTLYFTYTFYQILSKKEKKLIIIIRELRISNFTSKATKNNLQILSKLKMLIECLFNVDLKNYKLITLLLFVYSSLLASINFIYIFSGNPLSRFSFVEKLIIGIPFFLVTGIGVGSS